MAQDQADSIENRQAEITFANRAPNSKDKGLFWMVSTASTTSFYARNKVTGAWVLIGP